MLTLHQQDHILETHTMGDQMGDISEMIENPLEGVQENLQEGTIEKDRGLEEDQEKGVIGTVTENLHLQGIDHRADKEETIIDPRADRR